MFWSRTVEVQYNHFLLGEKMAKLWNELKWMNMRFIGRFCKYGDGTFCFVRANNYFRTSLNLWILALKTIFLSNCPRHSKEHWRSYIYLTVHHLDSWVKGDQLDVTCFIISLLNAQHVSDFNTFILRSLQLICWVISWVVLLWFDVCWIYVVVWLGWCGIRM